MRVDRGLSHAVPSDRYPIAHGLRWLRAAAAVPGLLSLSVLLLPLAPRPAAAVAADLVAELHESITAREYHAREGASGLQAPNRAHDFRTYFDGAGIRVEGRSARSVQPLVRLRATTLGRAATRSRVPTGELWSEAERVEIRRPGFVEWYRNSPEGLEQGFELATRPAPMPTASATSTKRGRTTPTRSTRTPTTTGSTTTKK